MKAGIIAAGKGERLIQGGISTPKPLIPVAGEPLIARVIRAAAEVGVTSIACVVNGLSSAVADYLEAGSWPVPIEVVVKTTPNSMESLFSLAPHLSEGPFLLFTVDAVFRFKVLEHFLARASALGEAQGVLALTRFVEDEKPLWVKRNRKRKVVAIGEDARSSGYVTAGFYYFRPDIFAMIESARSRKSGALRQFLGLLVENGYLLYGVAVPKTFDIDYPEDIGKAEKYLKGAGER